MCSTFSQTVEGGFLDCKDHTPTQFYNASSDGQVSERPAQDVPCVEGQDETIL